jgi:hypothetical protein
MEKISESVARRNGKWLWKHYLLSSYLRRELILIDTKECDLQVVVPIPHDSAGTCPAATSTGMTVT